jgi:DNA topoisomerase-1
VPDERAAAIEVAAQTAREAGLSYVTDERPGIRRVPQRGGFRYVDPVGTRVRDDAVLERIRALAIPPAWTDVWICLSTHGHLQATGRDARGRKQYRYHARWRTVRDENKFGRLAEFARALPAIRRRVATDLSTPGLPREKVLAAVVRLLETTFIRVGNERYARDNGSFGLTTIAIVTCACAGSASRSIFAARAAASITSSSRTRGSRG